MFTILTHRLHLLNPNRLLSAVAWQTLFLFAVDGVTNLVDYGFHAYLGRVLSPGDFAIVQTMNALFLVIVTAFAVLQPVVARYVAESAVQESEGVGAQSSAILPNRTRTGRFALQQSAGAVFRLYLGQSVVLGGALTVLVLLGGNTVAAWLNVPVAAVTLGAAMVFFSLVRPVVAGMLQGSERYVAFGITRTVYAVGRLVLALLLIGLLGGKAIAAVAVMPAGALLALVAGLLLIGPMWHDLLNRATSFGSDLPNRSTVSGKIVWEGWRLSLAALLAYTTYMLLQNIDLIWVNRTFSPDVAGSYATVVVLRRVLAVLPGAVLVVLYPRVVSRVAQGVLPDRLLLKAAAVIVTSTLAVTTLYFLFGPTIVALMFGDNYPHAAGLLGWQGAAMMGYGLAAVWLNLFLATRPWPFVGLLAAVSLLQISLLTMAHTIVTVTAVLILSGWLLVIGGLVLYLLWLRPRLLIQEVYVS